MLVITLTVLLIVGLLIVILVPHFVAHNRILTMCLVFAYLILTVLLLVFYVLAKRGKWNKQVPSLNYPVVGRGTTATVYKLPFNNQVVKVLTPGMDQQFVSQSFKHHVLFWYIKYPFIKKTLKRWMDVQDQVSALAKITNCKPHQWQMEYVASPLTPENAPPNWKDQLLQVGDELKKHGYYLVDVNADNIRVRSDGRLVIVDGYLLNKGEFMVYKKVWKRLPATDHEFETMMSTK